VFKLSSEHPQRKLHAIHDFDVLGELAEMMPDCRTLDDFEVVLKE